MDITKLELFILTAQLKNITKAGEVLGYTQSAASHMLKSLERELGNFSLFMRTNKNVFLTTEGERLLPYAQDLVRDYKQLLRATQSITASAENVLWVCGHPSPMFFWMSTIQKNFLKTNPNVTIKTMRGNYEEVSSWLWNGEADVGLIGISAETSSLETFPLYKDSFVVALPVGHPLSRKSVISISDLNGADFVRPTESRFCDIKQFLFSADIALHFSHIAHDYHEVLLLVASGAGVSIVPQMIASLYPSTVCLRPLAEPLYRTLGIGVCPNKKLSSPARSFVSVAQQLFSTGALP